MELVGKEFNKHFIGGATLILTLILTQLGSITRTLLT